MSKWDQWAFANTTFIASIGWFVGGDVAWASGLGENWDFPTELLFVVGGGIGFAISGLMTGYALRLAEPSMSWKHVSWISIGWITGLAIGWTCGFTIGKEIGISLYDQTKFLFIPIRSHAAAFAIGSTIGRTIGLGITFLTGGGVMGYTLRALDSLAIPHKQITWLALGWIIALALGMTISKFVILPTLVWIVEIIMDTPWAIGFAFGLVVLGVAVQLLWPALSWTHAALITIKWIAGMILGLLLGIVTISAILNIVELYFTSADERGPFDPIWTVLLLSFNPVVAMAGLYAIPEALGFAMAGAIGFSITLRCLRQTRP